MILRKEHIRPNYAFTGEALREFYELSTLKLESLLAVKGASFARAKMLSYIERHEDVRSIDLMVAFGHAPRTITVALDALERDGLVERNPDKKDRRAKIITLTDKGTAMQKGIDPLFKAFGDNLFSVLDESELVMLGKLLTRLNERLGEM